MNIFPVHAQSARNNHPPLFNPPLLPNNPNRYCFISTSFQTSPAAAASRDLPTCRFPATPTLQRDTDANIHNTTNTYRCVSLRAEGGWEGEVSTSPSDGVRGSKMVLGSSLVLKHGMNQSLLLFKCLCFYPNTDLSFSAT